MTQRPEKQLEFWIGGFHCVFEIRNSLILMSISIFCQWPKILKRDTLKYHTQCSLILSKTKLSFLTSLFFLFSKSKSFFLWLQARSLSINYCSRVRFFPFRFLSTPVHTLQYFCQFLLSPVKEKEYFETLQFTQKTVS